MSNKETQTTSKISLSTKLVVLFGAGSVIKAEVDSDRQATFTAADTILIIKLPEGVEFFGPGQYEITIRNTDFEYQPAD